MPPDPQTTPKLDDIDLFLLRVGLEEDGAMADDEPMTDRGEDMRDRCEGMVVLGLLSYAGTDRLGLIRHYHTTAMGIERLGGKVQ